MINLRPVDEPEDEPMAVVDLHDTDTIEVKALKLKDGTYKLWVNGPQGMLLRAYNVKTLIVELDPATLKEAVAESKHGHG